MSAISGSVGGALISGPDDLVWTQSCGATSEAEGEQASDTETPQSPGLNHTLTPNTCPTKTTEGRPGVLGLRVKG